MSLSVQALGALQLCVPVFCSHVLCPVNKVRSTAGVLWGRAALGVVEPANELKAVYGLVVGGQPMVVQKVPVLTLSGLDGAVDMPVSDSCNRVDRARATAVVITWCCHGLHHAVCGTGEISPDVEACSWVRKWPWRMLLGWATVANRSLTVVLGWLLK